MPYDEYDLPLVVNADGAKLKIRKKCEHRHILRCIKVLNDVSLPIECRNYCAFVMFYENYKDAVTDNQQVTAVREMMRIISATSKADYESSAKKANNKPSLVNWEKDYKYIAPAVSKVLGYDIRTPQKYTHWWTFISAYMETKDSYFNQIVAIRSKRQKNKNLEKWEKEFLVENYDDIVLSTLTPEEEAWLNSEW